MSSLRAALAENGFVIQRQVLSASDLEALREAATRTTERARSGNWPDVRTVGKQFPPWPKPTPGEPPQDGIWGVQGLLNPALGCDADVFARSYFNDKVLDVAKALMSCEEDGGQECTDEDLVLELYNMLVRPESDFELEWHRDDVPRTATPEEEAAKLGIRLAAKEGEREGKRVKKRYWNTQWNLPLYPDDSLIVVPGSHVRVRTPAEREAAAKEPNMPGQLVVHLEPGDVVFYDNNILHRGVYKADKERMSLHGSVGHAGGGCFRATNVLQHGIGKWIDQCDFSSLASGPGGGEKARQRAEDMRARLVKLGRESGDVGYSLTG
ncbi:phytanoyl-dioxygenase family protein [Xylaria bambusicola]|uniref:phytanoyl-dioxygenase family protein n=1 Tax=Xylaria bambusicola TaxID=326684 RepID=UPI00200786CC|nr:phytanoyl-dioxygenase family protein [Xylaria bambusicola]KAI0514900.1 phytanoyl-dioxygenase family protein [Xylaria bambusicola]